MAWRVLVGCVLAATLVGCGVSPQPEPPSVKPTLDGDAVGFQKNVIVMGVAFEAPPGAVEPAEGQMVIINLDRTDPPVFVPVQPDGSFKAVVDGVPEDEFRFQVRTATNRSVPVDLVGDATGTIVGPVVHPHAGCVIVTPPLELDFGSTQSAVEQSVRIDNDCATALSFVAPRFRTSDPSFSLVSPPQPFSLAAGEVSTLLVRFSPTEPGALEEILFIEVPSPERDRRPISLFGSD